MNFILSMLLILAYTSLLIWLPPYIVKKWNKDGKTGFPPPVDCFTQEMLEYLHIFAPSFIEWKTNITIQWFNWKEGIGIQPSHNKFHAGHEIWIKKHSLIIRLLVIKSTTSRFDVRTIGILYPSNAEEGLKYYA